VVDGPVTSGKNGIRWGEAFQVDAIADMTVQRDSTFFGMLSLRG
jgi:hypothetical protein